MPSKPPKHNTGDLYEAIRNGNGIPFEFVTGGVKYRAVLAHKDDREHKATIAPPRRSIAKTPLPGVRRQDSDQNLEDIDRYWNNRHDGWR